MVRRVRLDRGAEVLRGVVVVARDEVFVSEVLVSRRLFARLGGDLARGRAGRASARRRGWRAWRGKRASEAGGGARRRRQEEEEARPRSIDRSFAREIRFAAVRKGGARCARMCVSAIAREAPPGGGDTSRGTHVGLDGLLALALGRHFYGERARRGRTAAAVVDDARAEESARTGRRLSARALAAAAERSQPIVAGFVCVSV